MPINVLPTKPSKTNPDLPIKWYYVVVADNGEPIGSMPVSQKYTTREHGFRGAKDLIDFFGAGDKWERTDYGWEKIEKIKKPEDELPVEELPTTEKPKSDPLPAGWQKPQTTQTDPNSAF